jgi:hypothetical protein
MGSRESSAASDEFLFEALWLYGSVSTKKKSEQDDATERAIRA